MLTTDIPTCASSDMESLERARFFPGQLIAPDDLAQIQDYLRHRERRHNRFLHGWGVVCGARVKMGTDPRQIVIESGYILSPFGDEIVIDSDVTFDISKEGLDGNAAGPCATILDPWCSEVRVNRAAGQPLYVAVRYAECQTRPVRAAAGGCSCDQSECEYSRVRDSYLLRVLTSLPSSYTDPLQPPVMDSAVHCPPAGARSCTVCPSEPWVILADVTLDQNGHVSSLDCFRHRRYVATFGDYYYVCHGVASHPGPIKLPGKAPLGVGTGFAQTGSFEKGGDVSPSVAPSSTPGQPFLNPLTKQPFPTPEVAWSTALSALLRATFDPAAVGGITRAMIDTPALILELPATSLQGIDPNSAAADKLSGLGMQVGDVAGTPQEEFVATMTEGVSADHLQSATLQAAAVWARADGISKLVAQLNSP